MDKFSEFKKIISKRGLEFLVKYDEDKVYINLKCKISWVGQILVYEAVEPLKLKNDTHCTKINGIHFQIFFMDGHTPEEIEEVLKNFTKRP